MKAKDKNSGMNKNQIRKGNEKDLHKSKQNLEHRIKALKKIIGQLSEDSKTKL